MKHLLTALFVCLSLALFGQFRMVSNGNPGWAPVNDSTYVATVNLQSDLTGQSYLATQVVKGFRMFTPTEQLYRIDTVFSTTFSSANIQVVEVSNQYTTTTTAPTGQCMIYDPAGKETLPDAPFGSTGATAALNAAIVTYNARVIGNVNVADGGDIFNYSSNIEGEDYSLPLDTLLKYDHLYIHLRTNPSDPAVLTLPSPSPAEGRAKTLIINFGGQELNPGLGIITGSGALDIRQNNCYLAGTTYQNDTLLASNDDPRFVVYRTVGNANDYYRECQAIFTADGTLVSSGDTLPPAGGIVYETQTIGGATFDLAYEGKGVTVTNPAGGNYTLTPTSGTDLLWATVTGDDGTLNASQEMVLTVDNSTNSAPRRFVVQLYDSNNSGLVDQQTTSTNHTQTTSTNTTTLTVPGLNGFGAAGYKIEIR